MPFMIKLADIVAFFRRGPVLAVVLVVFSASSVSAFSLSVEPEVGGAILVLDLGDMFRSGPAGGLTLSAKILESTIDVSAEVSYLHSSHSPNQEYYDTFLRNFASDLDIDLQISGGLDLDTVTAGLRLGYSISRFDLIVRGGLGTTFFNADGEAVVDIGSFTFEIPPIEASTTHFTFRGGGGVDFALTDWLSLGASLEGVLITETSKIYDDVPSGLLDEFDLGGWLVGLARVKITFF